LTKGITFTSDKYKLIYFSRHRADQDPRHTPSVLAGLVTVSKNIVCPYLRWLGVDKKPSFKYHVKNMASKALIIANALRCLGNTVYGVNPYLIRQAIVACVLRKVYFGAETWWPGYSRPGPRTGLILSQVQGHLDQIIRVILAGVRVVLPIYHTTPTPTLPGVRSSASRD
jgi:hypothetical protein